MARFAIAAAGSGMLFVLVVPADIVFVWDVAAEWKPATGFGCVPPAVATPPAPPEFTCIMAMAIDAV